LKAPPSVENLTVIVFDAPRSGLELRIEQSDNDGDLGVRNDGDEPIVVQLLHAAKLIQQIPLESDETLYFHQE
jgi:hypothetical protein